jgi:hypothetical protein
MARGDGSVTREWCRSMIMLPPELSYVVRMYQKRNRITSHSAAVKRLLETHPDLLVIVSDLVYADHSPITEVSPR